MRFLPLVLVLLLFPMSARAQLDKVPADQSPPCETPAEFTTPSSPLPAVAKALNDKRPVEILALGSGSTVGDTSPNSGPAFAAVKTPGKSFPYRMVDALRALRPDAQFNLTLAGGRNMTADAMVPLLQEQLTNHRFDLVIWQTGTVEAVRGLRPDTLREMLELGIANAADKHADIVLVDSQFSRFMRANIDLDPYEWVMGKTADNAGVDMFHRLDLTQAWVDSGEVDLERVGRDQRDKTVALLNTCLGHALAEYVINGAKATN
jgi:acyl-CoA thioesterase I